MEQKDPLEELVNSVESEASKFASFDDYLASSKEEPCSPANAEVNSSKIENGSEVQGPDVSNPSSDASVASESVPPIQAERIDPRKLEMGKPGYIQNGLKTEPLAPVVPLPPDVSQIEPPNSEVKIAPEVRTVLELQNHPMFGMHFTEHQEIRKDEPDWWKTVWYSGQDFCTSSADPKDIIVFIHDVHDKMDQLKCLLGSLRAGLTTRLQRENAPRRAELLEYDKKYRSGKTQQSAERLKSEKGPKPSTKKTKGMHAVDSFMTMYTLEETMEKLKEFNLLDELTELYATKQYGGTK